MLSLTSFRPRFREQELGRAQWVWLKVWVLGRQERMLPHGIWQVVHGVGKSCANASAIKTNKKNINEVVQLKPTIDVTYKT